jgi:hypothetical protein
MSEIRTYSQAMQSMGNHVDRALDDKGKKPSQFEISPDISHGHDAKVFVYKPASDPTNFSLITPKKPIEVPAHTLPSQGGGRVPESVMG